jgi:hypothetical protein
MAEINAKLQALHEAVDGSAMTAHDILTTDVVKVSYANGTEVYVNYSKKDVTVDGVTIPALSYLVEGGGAQ